MEGGRSPKVSTAGGPLWQENVERLRRAKLKKIQRSWNRGLVSEGEEVVFQSVLLLLFLSQTENRDQGAVRRRFFTSSQLRTGCMGQSCWWQRHQTEFVESDRCVFGASSVIPASVTCGRYLSPVSPRLFICKMEMRISTSPNCCRK